MVIEMNKKNQEIVTKFNGINKEREQDELIIYTNEHFRNSYGFEVAVDSNNRVINKTTLTKLPENGFIVSGHGLMHQFIIDNIQIGDFIELDTKNNKIIIKSNKLDSLLFYFDFKLAEIKDRFKAAEMQFLDLSYEDAKNNIELMETLKRNLINCNEIDDETYKNLKAEFDNLDELAYQHLTHSEIIEARGIWHRPKENNLEKLLLMLDDLKNTNINEIYVETLWDGFAIYPSKVFPYHPRIQGDFGKYGNDYLKALINEAKLRNISVHAWVENFFVGNIKGLHSEVWENHPDWQIINYNNLRYQTGKPGNEEEGFLFFDPSNPEAQEFVLSFYEELLKSYEIDGLQLDYIRYPAANENYIYSTGYTEYAMNKFMEDVNLKIDDMREFVKDENNYELWNKWRQSQITNFVKRVYDKVLNLRNDILFSIAVGPDPDYAKINLMQDWGTWVRNGWIDIVCPMAYVRSNEQIRAIVEKQNRITNNYTYNYTGVSPTYDKLPDIYNTYFIDESYKSGALGSVIFAYHNLEKNPNVKAVLKRGTHRRKSIQPHQSIDKIYEVLVKDIEEKLLEKLVPNKVLKLEDAMVVISSLKNQKNSDTDFEIIKNNINMAMKTLNNLGDKDPIKVIKFQLNRFNKIITIKQNRILLRKENKNE